MEQKHLYSRDANNNISHWAIKVYESDTLSPSAKIIISFGRLSGTQITRTLPISEGKNIGKQNETTPYQQAVLEANSRYNRQLKLGYKPLGAVTTSINTVEELEVYLQATLPIHNTDNNDNIMPMKAQQYFKTVKKGGIEKQVPRLPFPNLGQPKINGIRAFVKWQNSSAIIFSKKGLVYKLPHISNLFKKEDFYYDGVEIIYDGELFIPGMKLNEIKSAVDTPQLTTPLVTYYAFDLAIESVEQVGRWTMLKEIIPNHVKLVPIVVIKTDAIAQAFTDKCIEDGYEGAIFRDIHATYAFGKRSPLMTKLKRRESAEFRILDVIDSRDAPGIGMFICLNDINNETFKVVPEGDIAQKREYFNNKHKYINKMLTVEFYERSGVKEVPFHAVGITVRDYE